MKKDVVGAIVVMLVLTGIGEWYFTNSQAAHSGVSEPITIGEFPYETPMRPGRGSHVTDGKPHIVIRSL